MKYTKYDLAAYFFTGALTLAFGIFLYVSYAKAQEMGYTPEARAHLDYLVSVYNEPDYDAIPRLSISDLE